MHRRAAVLGGRSTAAMAYLLAALLTLSLHEGAAGADFTLQGAGLALHKPLHTLREQKTRYVVFQQYDFSCGAAVIATLLTYYFGEPASEKDVISGIAERADMEKVLQRKAFSLLDMKRFAQARGYEAVGYRMDFDFLVELDQPVIVPVEMRGYKHFVIVKGIVGDRVVIADPAFGNYTRRITQFLAMWPTRIGFVLKRLAPSGPMTQEDRERQALFMPPDRIGAIVTQQWTPSFTPIPGQVQAITGPRPLGGSFLDFFHIHVP